MYKQNSMHKTTIEVNNSQEGETIEAKVRKILANREPITDGAPIIYTERKDGVLPEYNIKTDRWEHAQAAFDKASKTNTAKRKTMGEQAKEGMNKEQKNVGEAKPITGTDNK